MKRVLILLALSACWGAAKHAMRAHQVAAELRPACHELSVHEQADRGTVAADNADDDGWLWWVDTCGEWLWCRYDERGVMKCHDEPSPAVEAAALFYARCGGPVSGRYSRDGVWQVAVCGKHLECVRIEQQWQCRDQQ